MPLTRDQQCVPTAFAVVRHWDERFGFCRLEWYPSPVGETRWETQVRRQRDENRVVSDFRDRHGYWPPIVMSGGDGIAVGPTEVKRCNT